MTHARTLALAALAASLLACSRPPQGEPPPPGKPAASGSPLFRGSQARGAFRQVRPAQVAEHRASSRVIDVREPDEFNDSLGHIPGATLVPLGNLGEQASSWDHDAELVVVCRSGSRSGRASARLASMGFSRVMNMEGGMLAYNAAHLPVERR